MRTDRPGPVGGLVSYVRPTFMLPAVGMSLFGGLLAPAFGPLPGALHGLAVGLALYVAHLNDGYVDAHVRGEDPPVLSARENRLAVLATSALFFGLLAALGWQAGPAAVLATAPLWALAVLHAPHLDTNPVTVTVDYPVGIGLAVVGGYLVQAGRPPGVVLGASLVFVVLLSGIKVSIDRLDYRFDRSIDKRTVPVVLGADRANAVAALLLLAASALVVGLVVAGVFPAAAAAAGAVVLPAAAAGFVASPPGAVRLQILLAYPFAALLFVACCSATACSVSPLLAL